MVKKELYMASSMSELVEKSQLRDTIISAKQAINTMNKLVQKGRELELDGDDEYAYLLYIRYFEMYKQAKQCADYKKDSAYFENMIGKKNFGDILNRATDLNESLRQRYDFLQAEKLSERLEKEREPDKGRSTKPNVRSVQDLSPSKMPGWITVAEFVSSFQQAKNMVVMDLRPKEEFEASHIKMETLLSIPEEWLLRGCTVQTLERQLAQNARDVEHDLALWRQRGAVASIVMLDWCSRVTSAPLQSIHPMMVLKDAMFKWDAAGLVKKEPLMLDGGMKELLLRYPTYTTNPVYKRPVAMATSVIDSKKVQELIQYPDFEKREAEKRRKKEEQEAERRRQEQEALEMERNHKQLQELAAEAKRREEKEAEEKKKREEEKKKRQAEKASRQFSSDSEGSDDGLAARLKSLKMKKEPEKDRHPVVDRSVKPAVAPAAGLSSSASTSKSVTPQVQPVVPPKVEPTPTRTPTPPVVKPTPSPAAPASPKKSPHLETNATPHTRSINRPSNEAPARLSVTQHSERDRASFAAKGGAKPSTVMGQGVTPVPTKPMPPAPNLPLGWEKVHDQSTNRYFYIDHENKKTFWEIPTEYLVKQEKETIPPPTPAPTHTPTTAAPAQVSKPKVTVESLKHEPSASPNRNRMSGMKRSGSQPNLASLSGDQDVGSRDSRRPPPEVGPPGAKLPDRTLKPSSKERKQIQVFDAHRLRRMDPNYGHVKPGLTGLRNLGNTCYMNSVLQSLNNTPLLMHYFRENLYIESINRSNPLGHKGEVAEEFDAVVKALWSGYYKDISPKDFKAMVSRHAAMFAGYQQQDSQEFLLFLLDGLHEDLNQVVSRPKTQFQDREDLGDEQRAELSWDWHTKINKSIIVQIFQGQLKSTLMCTTCNKQSVTFDAFMYLSLPIYHPSRCSLKDCLDLFLQEERMTGNSKWFCPACKEMRDAVKKIDIWKLPPYLLIHLKRFSCEGAYRQKLNSYVEFPMRSLNLSNVIKSPQRNDANYVYNLYAASNHYGSMEGGHYTAYCLNKLTNDWYKFDDDVVTHLRQDEIKTTAAYILFYESTSITKQLHLGETPH